MITVEHLTKCYGDFMAVNDLSFSIEEGHVYGFLGPNGAGKSTTMNIMTGCLSATAGHVRIDDYDIFEDPGKAKRLIGYLPEQPPLYMNETPVEYLRFVGEAKGLRGAELEAQIREVIEQTRPEALAIEKLFYQHNQTTVIGVAEARGVILLAAAQAGLPIYEYTPMQVKQAVTGYGKAVKKQVQEMTRVLLHLPAVPKPDDTADALAMAITFCHTNGNQLNRFVRRVAGPI